MTIKLIDSHTHVQFAAFEKDYQAVIERALSQGIGLINVGTQKDTSRRAVEITNEYPSGVWATVGLHPTVIDEGFDYEYYKDLAINPKVVAVGECGLDYYRLEPETKEKQMTPFEAQIRLAHETKKPLMIHCRSAFADLIQILNSKSSILNSPPGIVHFFSGTKEDARKLLALGLSFSFGGVLTFARDYDEVVRYLPLENILLETDSPYVAPVPYRGKRNEPLYVIEVAKKIAEIKNLNFEEVARITTGNAIRIFNLNKL